jgi:HPt (histidine-containing phosphotransfer) domain-containing protein
MAQLAQAATVSAEPAAAAGPVIDLAHLKRMTFGERSLERELLQLFDRQAAMLVARMRQSAPAVTATLAHTLKGSARSIGAGPVAQAAETAERAAMAESGALAAALDRLDRVVALARAEIAPLL